MSETPIIVWFRRNLRLSDQPALITAAEAGAPIIPVYILDDETPGHWRLGGASRWWLLQSLRSLEASLRDAGSRLIFRRGRALDILLDLAKETKAEAVYFTRGYEPFIVQQERTLHETLKNNAIECRRFTGHLLVEPEAIETKSGEPFKVFTPFYKACLSKEPISPVLWSPDRLQPPSQWPKSENLKSWRLEPQKPDWAREMREFWTPGETGARKRLVNFIGHALASYKSDRDQPGKDGTSRLSPYLAFGEISARQIWHAVDSAAKDEPQLERGADAFIRELYWREFSYHLLFHWPGIPESSFRPEFEKIPWRKDSEALKAWTKGLTGYPIADAGLRQLWAIGWMHNRVRMIVASLLTKHLLIPWREGEDWFWDTLVDADLANNAASWQWVAGSGADAAPYFRVFNPILQGKKFDPEGNYVRRWVPELAEMPAEYIHSPWEAPESVLKSANVTLGVTYPLPIIEHEKGRKQALEAYEAVKAGNQKN
jgi:deoxyribodipyrimidine photo-lyase